MVRGSATLTTQDTLRVIGTLQTEGGTLTAPLLEQ